MFRKLFTTAAVMMAALIFCACAYADAALYIGSRQAGAVQTIENNSGLFVPVEDIGKLLGFSSSRNGEELLLQRGNIQLRLVDDSAAAWYGFSIVPLYSPPLRQNNKTWLDSSSAAALFQRVVGSAQNNRLRINKISGSIVTANNAISDIDVGDFDFPEPESKPEPKQTQTAAKNPVPVLIVPEIKTAPKTPAAPTVQPQTQTQTIAKNPAPVVNVPEVKTASQTSPETKPKVQQSSTSSASTLASTPSTNSVDSTLKTKTAEKKAKAQPKLEIFRLGDAKGNESENYSGVIQGIRWTSQEETHKKIRAVILVDEDAEPSVFMNGSELHALLASSLETTENLASPFSNVKLEVRKNSRGVDLVFSPEKISKAEKIVLNNPKRIVFDFFFPSSIAITKIKTENNSAAQQVQQATQPKPVQIQTPVLPQITAQKNEEKIEKEAPAKTLILIPTTPQAANPITPRANIPARTSITPGRKTIVIDPGHGGKDPGASDNGVVEKNVNLAVGLELEKSLLARGYNVIMTRRTDIYLKLQERTDIANDMNADLFVSIHVNALPSKKTMTGFEIYIMALPTDKDAMNLAKIENREYVEGKGMDTENVDRRTEMLLKILGDMQQNNKISESTDFAAALYNAGVRNSLPMRRVAQAPFFVLRGAGMPAVLLETGFVTNASESHLLTTQAYQQKIALAMTEGIINYIH